MQCYSYEPKSPGVPRKSDATVYLKSRPSDNRDALCTVYVWGRRRAWDDVDVEESSGVRLRYSAVLKVDKKFLSQNTCRGDETHYQPLYVCMVKRGNLKAIQKLDVHEGCEGGA